MDVPCMSCGQNTTAPPPEGCLHKSNHHRSNAVGAPVWPEERIVCPDHGIPDCSPLLNGCSRVIKMHECKHLTVAYIEGRWFCHHCGYEFTTALDALTGWLTRGAEE